MNEQTGFVSTNTLRDGFLKVDDDCGVMAAVRSSPRLRALLYSNPSGKPAVFAPRLNRGSASDRTLRSKNSTSKDSVPISPSKLSRGKRTAEKKPVASKVHSKGIRNKGGASENALVGKRRHSDSPRKTQQSLTSHVAKAQIGSSKRAKGEKMLGAEVATRCKQRKRGKALTSSANDPLRKLEQGIVNSTTDSGDMSTCVSVKRKRGRPPKNAATSCKRVKIVPTITRGNTERPKVVVDLTCDNEIIGDDDIDAALESTPPLFTDLDLTQISSANTPFLEHTLEVSNDQHDGEGTNTASDMESDYLGTSLDPDETIAQLFDLGTKESHTTAMSMSSNNKESETVTIPSLKRSKNINPLATTTDIAGSVHTPDIDNSSSADTPDTPSSPTEELEYPQPSTPQQKLIRRLARQKQLEEMKAREAALEREKRLLRRKGVLPDTNATRAQEQSSTKRISWRDETDLVEMFIYSPVWDDDDDTVSIQSDDALNIEITLSPT